MYYLNAEHNWKAHRLRFCQKLTRDLEDMETLLANMERGRGLGPGTFAWENTSAFAYDVFEGFQRKNKHWL